MPHSISNNDDVIDSRDVIARIKELEEALVPRYVAGWNTAGDMRDAELDEFDDADDARDCIVERMREAAEAKREAAAQALDYGREDDAARLNSKADELDRAASELAESDGGPTSTTVAGVAYWITQDGTTGLDDDEREELAALKALAAEAEGCADWRHGETLIRESYFEDYARQLADEIGAVQDDAQWPMNCIDWKQAARELAMDYTTVDFDGVEYLIRS
jgi:hypothetical protein